MPEMPEVEALRHWLEPRLTGRSFTRVEIASLSALKTVALPPSALLGLEVERVERRGKFLGMGQDGAWLVFHLARAGWLRWYDELPASLARPGKSPLALRVGVDDGSGFDLTEAGTRKHLAVYVVAALEDVPGIADLGPDPLAPEFGRPQLDAILDAAGRAQLKGVLRDQKVLAGIGNAYSDEILHAARMSPFKPASSLDDAERETLLSAMQDTLRSAIERADGLKPSELKDGKRSSMAVHGRTGLSCPVCGTTVAEVSFADSSLQYCPGCQTGGKPLADRRLSRLLK
ncbi:MAG TPA: DNA-formamidopyrimidine glycosylase family protein [Propionibacteriaceae bacterium]|nr:DNA-formamidopyrimidine glycosylase family protein [Propionibacteriaceae bacterium]